MRAVAIVSAVLSFVVPGAGQVLRRRWVEAALFLVAALYLRLLLTGLAGPDERIEGLVFGAFGVARGVSQPTFLVFTVLALVLHALAAWDAYGGRRPADGRPEDEGGRGPETSP